MRKLALLFLITTSLLMAESLWQGERKGLFNDHNARQVGDSITVVVLEAVSSTQRTGSSIGNSNQVSVGSGSGFASFLPATALPNSSTFKADGSQTSEGRLAAEITVKVTKILPNGEMEIAGDKVTDINGEQQIIDISGVVRPENILEGNKVFSSTIANARISYRHDGEMKNAVEPGYLTKVFNMVF